MPNFEFCANITDPYDLLVEEHKGFCKFALSKNEYEMKGEKWKSHVQNGVIMSMESFEKLLLWGRTTCRKTNNECVMK